jgi:DNA repair exonuclease SbcCD nuclease subunit
MKTLVIGDLHLRDFKNNRKYLEDQTNAIEGLLDTYSSPMVVFLGDIFHFRKPSARELLAFKHILNHIEGCKVAILRGNHDSETKGDDGVTSLSVFKGYPGVAVYTHTGRDPVLGYTFIPHYEDQEITKRYLAKVPKGDVVFGHFGYKGAYNSVGDYDSEIPIELFKNPTILGHIHYYKHVTPTLITLGTPFSTDYLEAGRGHKILLWGEGEVANYVSPERGIRHLRFNYEELEANTQFIDDPSWDTYLRVYFNELTDFNALSLRKEIFKKYNVRWVDVKFMPLINTDESVSTLEMGKDVFAIDDTLIERYVDENTTDIPKEDLMAGLEELKVED